MQVFYVMNVVLSHHSIKMVCIVLCVYLLRVLVLKGILVASSSLFLDSKLNLVEMIYV